MPDEHGICHCGGTGADGCEPRLSPEQTRYQRRHGILDELNGSDAQGFAIPPRTTSPAEALIAAGRNPLLEAPTAHPLLAQIAGREPLLVEALRLDRHVTAKLKENPDVQ